ncbi:hypothetical protein HNR22_003523 [Micromonospora jinlongensis]|uniref:Uncharacterized protein n=1 Tax=Micromonospora jinlongensis TaxID=1287877 RepID=A0A7Z0BEB5_9ACTN|nr:hypothetical protein [Micromonospora jinlongensis]NYH43796.1 hypothetical protein [Micromonospora jinlongensis]
MDTTADDRLRSAVLVGAAVAVLAVGGWWWQAAAPASTARSAAPAIVPSAGPSVSTALERALVTAVPGERLMMRVDASGEVVSIPEGVRPEFDPETGMIVDIHGDPAALSFEGELPSFRDTVWQERAALAPGQSVVRQAPGDSGRHLLQYRCTRPGTMLVSVSGAGLAGPSRIACDGTIANAEVLAHGRPFRVSLSTAVEREIDVQAQLVLLPR